MAFAAALRAHKAKAFGLAHAIVRETADTFAESLVSATQFQGPWTPIGMPETWKSPPPADYRPGNARSSWFLSVGSPSTETTERTDIQKVNGMDRLPDKPAGARFYFSNSAPHIGALEGSHSRQAPVGIMVNAAEFQPMVNFIARRLSA